MPHRRLDHRFRSRRAILLQQVLLERTSVHTDANRHFLRLRGADNFADTFVCSYIAGVKTKFVDASFQRHQSELVVEVNIGNERDFGNAFADLFQGQRGIVVRNS